MDILLLVCSKHLIRDTTRPNVIIAETIKGKGVTFMENKYIWHYGVLSEARYNKAILEINNTQGHGQ